MIRYQECSLAPRMDTFVFPYTAQFNPPIDPTLTKHHLTPLCQAMAIPMQLNSEHSPIVNGMYANASMMRSNLADQSTDTSRCYKAPRSMSGLPSWPVISAMKYEDYGEQAPISVYSTIAPQQCLDLLPDQASRGRDGESSFVHQCGMTSLLEQYRTKQVDSSAVAECFSEDSDATFDTSPPEVYTGIGYGYLLHQDCAGVHEVAEIIPPGKASRIITSRIENATVIPDGAEYPSPCSFVSKLPLSGQTGIRRKGQELYRPDIMHTEKCPECHKFFSAKEIR